MIAPSNVMVILNNENPANALDIFFDVATDNGEVNVNVQWTDVLGRLDKSCSAAESPYTITNLIPATKYKICVAAVKGKLQSSRTEAKEITTGKVKCLLYIYFILYFN